MRNWIRKSILPVLLIFCSLLLFPEAKAATEGYYTYSVSGGQATITDCSAAISGDITIPSTLGGYPVTAIGYQAFEDCTGLTGVIIPEGVTSIGGRAFYQCTGLTDIALPDSVTGIGSYAFAWCESLTGIEIPDGITKISDDMFFHCTGLTDVIIPDSVKTIGAGSFSYCWSLAAIDIPECVTEIGGSAFFHCKALTDITIPAGVTALNSYVFAHCQSLTHLEIPGSVNAINEHAFYNCTSLERIAIPGGIAEIGKSAFRDCGSLTEIVIPNSVTVIGENAFRGCAGLTELTIPDGVATIKKYAFGECTGLLRVTVPDSVTAMENDVFRECTALTEVMLGKGITSISGYAFWGCTALKEITIPAGVTAIGSYAFTSCTGMTRVTIPESVTTIGNGAFRNCTGLTEINVADIAAWLKINFGTTDSNPMRADVSKKLLINGQVISELELPAGITELPEYAFYKCASLHSVVIPGSVATIGGNAFYSCSGLTKLTVLDGVTGIGTQAFYNCTALTDISLAGSVATIGARGFYGCKALAEITLPEGVTTIGTAAFSRCTGLTGVAIPGSVTTIGSSAFSGCSSLRYVNYADTMAQWAQITIGENNDPLQQTVLITTDTSVTQISIHTLPTKTEYLLGEMLDTTGLVLKAVWTSGAEAEVTGGFVVAGFDADLPGQQTLTVTYEGMTTTFTVLVKKGGSCGDGLRWILDDSGTFTVTGTGAMTDFVNSEAVPWYQLRDEVKKVVIEKGVTSIGKYAFSYCGNLEEVTIPSGSLEIGGYAFSGCIALTWIDLSNSSGYIGSGAFYGCNNITELDVSGRGLSHASLSGLGGLEKLTVSYSGMRGGFPTKYSEGYWSYDIPFGYFFGEFSYEGGVKTAQYKYGRWYDYDLGGWYNTTEEKVYYYLPATLKSLIFTGDSIQPRAFTNFKSLTSVTLTKNIREIGYYAFCNCQGLTDVYYDGSEKEWQQITIEAQNNELTKATLHTVEPTAVGLSIVSLPAKTVYDQCDALDIAGLVLEVTMSNGETMVIAEGYTVSGYDPVLPGEQTVTLWYEEVSTTFTVLVKEGGSCGDGLRWILDDSGTLTVTGTGAMTDFVNSEAVPWYQLRDEVKKVVIEKGVTSIGKYAFSYCGNLEEITIPSSVLEIGAYAFERTHSLERVELPAGLQTMGSYLFYRSEGLESIVIPNSVTALGASAFSRCINLKQVTIGTGVTKLERYTFYTCTSLTDITVPDSVTELGDQVFENCSGLASVTLSRHLAAIGKKSLSGCTALQDVYYRNTGAKWAEIIIGDTNEPLFAATLHTREETVAAAIVGQPADVLVQAGDTASFTVIAEGDGLSYRWQYKNAGAAGWNNTSLTGYNTNTLTIYNVQGAGYHGRQFRCVVTDASGNTVTSEPAKLSVPYIVKQPATAFGTAVNSDHQFTVEYSISEGVTYQWQYKGNTASSTTWNNTSMAGNKTNTLTVPAIATRNGYRYRCVINDNGTEIVTKEVILYVTAAEAMITKQPAAASAVCGDYATFTVEATGDGLIYQWQWSDDGESWSDTRGTGYATSTLTVKTNNFNGGRLYRCVVKTVNGSAYNKVYSEPALMTVLPAAEITEQPQSVTVWAGETVLFHVEAEGEDLNYQWQWAKYLGNWMNTTAAGNTTDTLTVTNVNKEMNGRYYRVIITNKYTGTVTTQYCQLFVE